MSFPGPRGSGVIGINGAAAHLVHPGDMVIIMSYAMMDDAEARAMKPHVVHVDEQNRVVKIGNDAAEPVPGTDQKRGDAVEARLSGKGRVEMSDTIETAFDLTPPTEAPVSGTSSPI